MKPINLLPLAFSLGLFSQLGSSCPSSLPSTSPFQSEIDKLEKAKQTMALICHELETFAYVDSGNKITDPVIAENIEAQRKNCANWIIPETTFTSEPPSMHTSFKRGLFGCHKIYDKLELPNVKNNLLSQAQCLNAQYETLKNAHSTRDAKNQAQAHCHDNEKALSNDVKQCFEMLLGGWKRAAMVGEWVPSSTGMEPTTDIEKKRTASMSMYYSRKTDGSEETHSAEIRTGFISITALGKYGPQSCETSCKRIDDPIAGEPKVICTYSGNKCSVQYLSLGCEEIAFGKVKCHCYSGNCQNNETCDVMQNERGSFTPWVHANNLAKLIDSKEITLDNACL